MTDLIRRNMMMAKQSKIIGIEFYVVDYGLTFILYNHPLKDNQTAIITIQQLTSSRSGTPILLSASTTHSPSNYSGAVSYSGMETPNNYIYIRGGGTWSDVKATPTPNDIISLIINKNELKIQLNGIDADKKDISNYASNFGNSIATGIGGVRKTIFYDFKIVEDGTEISHIIPKMDGDTPILYDIVLNKKIEIPEDFILTPIFK